MLQVAEKICMGLVSSFWQQWLKIESVERTDQFSMGDTSSYLKVSFSSTGLEVILEWKDHCASDVVFWYFADSLIIQMVLLRKHQ